MSPDVGKIGKLSANGALRARLQYFPKSLILVLSY